MTPGWTIERLRDEILVLGARGLPRDEFFAELAARLGRVIGNDGTCWHTLDPATLLLTGDSPGDLVAQGVFPREEIAAAGELMVRSEYLVEDVNTFAGVARRRVPVGILDQATRGRPERSARYRDLLAPAGIPHEMRAAFLIRGRVWGAVHIARRAASGGFTERDAEALAQLAGPIALGIRASLRFDAARRQGGAEAPGLVVLSPDDEVELITAPARALLREIAAGATDVPEGSVPIAVIGLASHARRGAGHAVTVPGTEGWVTLHASLPGGAGDGRVAVVIERAAAREAATLRLEAHGVTAREREVATLLARGLSHAEIAEALVLSPHTVQDHVRSVYEKVGVTSRPEFVARVFLDEYLPEVVAGTPLTSRGRFDRS